uniref:Glyco_hydro38C2 domain-containing protein n=1 Tax=Steinernema glaseri TaxID=37863 RepID=A0A1I8A5W5_9BILA
MHSRGESKKPLSSSFEALQQDLPCDLHMVTLRTSSAPTEYALSAQTTRPTSSAALILHRLGVDCRSKLNSTCSLTPSGTVNVNALFADQPKAIHTSSLTMLYDGPEIKELRLEPMDLKTVKLVFP